MVLTDEPGAKSWPIAGAIYILMYKEQQDAATARGVLQFFDWAYANGDQVAENLFYIPMPEKVVQLIHQQWASEIQANGQPVWTE